VPFSRYIALAEAIELAKTHRATPRAIALARSYNYNMETWWSYTRQDFSGTEFFIFGMISDGVERFIEQLKTCTGKLIFRIDSPGGDTSPALTLARWIAKRGNCTGIVSGRCESAACLILAGCARRCAVPGAVFMLHAIKLATCGTAPQLRAQANYLDGYVAEASDFLAVCTGRPLNHVSALLTGPELYLNTAEAVAFGLIHEVVSESPRASGDFKLPTGSALPAFDDSLAYELAQALARLRVKDKEMILQCLPDWLTARPAGQPDVVRCRRPAGILAF
jgi:ATP-dependent protease ClpP protease subunit